MSEMHTRLGTRMAVKEMVANLRSGYGPLMELSRSDLVELVAIFAPYGREAREQMFREMRDRADSAYPCQYD